MKSVNKKFVRIMAIVLAAIFVLSVFITAGIGAMFSAGAAEIETAEENAIISYSDEAEDMTSSASPLSDKDIRVALFFKNSSYDLLRMNHSISSATGFQFFMCDENGNEILSYSSPVKSISVVRENHVAKNSSGVYETVSASNAQASVVALRMTSVFPDEYSLKQELTYAISKNGYDPIYPIIHNGGLYLGLGDFTSEENALNRYSKIASVYNREFAIKYHSDSYITVIDNQTGKIVLRADTQNYPLNISPRYKESDIPSSQKKDDTLLDVDIHIGALSPEATKIEINEPDVEYDTLPYITTAVGNIFAGTFEYTASSEGLVLINILKMDDYIKSVVPYEIHNNWPEETIKAFSIAARTYALTTFHKNENFDMCSETHCQAYMGRKRSTEYSDACVDATTNLILTYNNQPAHTFYHAISGGYTESASNVWGSSPDKYPYLVSVNTPWEKYSSYSNGLWSTSVTMKELSDYILSKPSYASKISSPITDIKIIETMPSGYVTKVLLVSADGSEYTVTTADRIRILLSKYVKSANFILARGIPIIKANSAFDTILPQASYSVLTSSGEDSVNFSDNLHAITSSGTLPVTADSSLQIIGKGHGHGVGLSQYGAKDMADLGYTYDQILYAYFPGTVITNYQ
ncbi:MAG: SpoIID/LytB domain-containing protein [Clostridia bacterium]|nr:SpoIID/LytB domain-containing protein [Clostridia bacterium]